MILRAPNIDRLISGKPKTYLAAAQAAASGSLSNVESIAGFSVGQMLIIGLIGEERTEVGRVHTATTPSGSTITLNANTSFRHEAGTPVFMTDYDQVEFSRATTEAGSKSVLATATITPDQMETIYDDTSNTTGFGFYRFKNSATSAYSEYSDPIPYAGYSLDAAASIIERALSQASASISPKLKYEDLFRFLSDFSAYANAKNTRWSECKTLNYELDTISTGDWEFSLPSNIARNTDPSAIIGVHVRGYQPLIYADQKLWNRLTTDLIYTTITSALEADYDTIVATNSKGFADSGSVEIEGDSAAYTSNSRASNVLLGVTGIGTSHAVGAYVFQNHTKGAPTHYTVSDDGKLRVWPICGSEVNNRVIYLDFYRQVPKVDSLGDKILLVNAVKAATDYVAYRIKKHMAGGVLNVGDEDFRFFNANMEELVERDNPGEPIRVRLR